MRVKIIAKDVQELANRSILPFRVAKEILGQTIEVEAEDDRYKIRYEGLSWYVNQENIQKACPFGGKHE